MKKAAWQDRESEWIVKRRYHTKAVVEIIADIESRFEFSGLMSGKKWPLQRAIPNS